MKLVVCPFCGSQLLSLEMVISIWGGNKKEPVVVCDDCGASAPIYNWNQRVVLTEQISCSKKPSIAEH